MVEGRLASCLGGGDAGGGLAISDDPSSATSINLSRLPAISSVFFSDFLGGVDFASGEGSGVGGCFAGGGVGDEVGGSPVLRSWTPASAVMTSLMRASLSDWMALMIPISMCRRLLVAHFIWPSVCAKISTRLSRRSVGMFSTDC